MNAGRGDQMRIGPITARITPDTGKQSVASIAVEELQLRIEASGLGDALARMACDLCMEEVPVEEAFQKIQESAIEKMVRMLDSTILSDEGALKSCLETVTTESERVAWAALERGTEELREGLALLEEVRGLDRNGYLN
jgi:hypothetical protein